MADTTQQKAKQYGRQWQVLIYKPAYTKDANGNAIRDKAHDTAIDVSRLKCIWKTQQSVGTVATLCTLAVYNMNAATEGEVIREGFQISIAAGYKDGQYGEIFSGDIVQVYRNRENGIDYRLEIVALRSTAVFDVNHVRTTLAAGSTPRDTIAAVAKHADTPIEINKVNTTFPETPLPRGKVLFGTVQKYYRDICVEHDASYYTDDDNKLVFRKNSDEIPASKTLVMTPVTGLIGTPQYSDDGIHIKMLMDSRVKLHTLIQIDNEIIQRQPVNIDVSGKGNNTQYPQQQQFDKDGEYEVYSVSHSGDTWGNDWSTSVVGIGRNGRKGLLVSISSTTQTSR